MSKRVFDLQGVPDDEAQEVRTLLSKMNIKYYETHEGDFLGGAALWVDSENEHQRARLLIEEYQRELRQRVRSAYRASGHSSIFYAIRQKVRQNTPFLIFSILVLVILIYMLTLGLGRR